MDKVKYSVQEEVAVIQLDNPPLNTFGYEQRQGVLSGIDKAAADPKVKAIIIIGSDRAFSGGADISEFGTDKMLVRPDLRELIAAIETCAKPVIAAMAGTCFGGGLELPLGCHYRVAKPDANIALPEVKIGILPGAGGTQRLPRAIGLEHAVNIILSGNAVPAIHLKDTALFDEIIEGDLLTGALAFAKKLIAAGTPPKLLRDVKITDPTAEPFLQFVKNTVTATVKNYPAPLKCVEALEGSFSKPFHEGLQQELELIKDLFLTPESTALRHLFFAERTAAKIPDVPKETLLRKIEKVAVVGAGTMGGGIAMAFLNAGFPVTLLEVTQEALDRGLDTIHKNYMASLQKGKITLEELEKIKALIKPSLSYDDLKEADLIIEAVFEDMDVKKGVFQKLDAIAKPGAILATNTSTLDVNKIASFTKRPQDVIGMHFFSPAFIMKLLEIVRGEKTGKDVLATIMDLCKTIKKIGVVSGVCDGFIANRMIAKYAQGAQWLLQQGASPQQIDKALEEWGMAMGPFRMGDLAGNDVSWYIRKRHYEENPSMERDIISDKLCELGRFGQKTGAGWYRYEPGSRNPLPDPLVDQILEESRKEMGIKPRKISHTEIIERCIYPLINEGARILDEGIALRASDIDVIYIYGFGFPSFRGGPMIYADTISPFSIVRSLNHFASEPDADAKFWEPSPFLRKLAETGKTFT
jgi:3-hydroxyacyl-CoA dehydrogenase